MTEKYQQEITTLFGNHVIKVTENLSERVKDGIKVKVLAHKDNLKSSDDTAILMLHKDDLNLYLDLVLYLLDNIDSMELIDVISHI